MGLFGGVPFFGSGNTIGSGFRNFMTMLFILLFICCIIIVVAVIAKIAADADKAAQQARIAGAAEGTLELKQLEFIIQQDEELERREAAARSAALRAPPGRPTPASLMGYEMRTISSSKTV